MAPLDRNLNRASLPHERQTILLPAAAGRKYYNGQLVAIDRATGMAVPAADIAGLTMAGVLVEPLFPDDPQLNRYCHLDNTNGEDGVVRAGDGDDSERALRADTRGPYAFRFEGLAPKPFQLAYVVDDQTLTATPTANGLVAGVTLRPAPDSSKVFGDTDWWYVDIARRAIEPA